MAQFSNDPRYQRHDVGGYAFYSPVEHTDYHFSRKLAMQVQDIYSRCGITKEVLKSFADEIIIRCNEQMNKDKFRSDMAVLGNNILYRLEQISDEDCAIKMGAIAVFLEGEEPDIVHEAWTRKKIDISRHNKDVRDFFLHLGIALTPEYVEALRGLAVEEYLTNRREILASMTPKFTRENT